MIYNIDDLTSKRGLKVCKFLEKYVEALPSVSEIGIREKDFSRFLRRAQIQEDKRAKVAEVDPREVEAINYNGIRLIPISSDW